MPYIRLKAVKHIRKAGIQKTYHKGDWVEVGRQAALAWLADGTAEIPGPDASKMEVVEKLLGPGCGVRIRSKVVRVGTKANFGNCLKALKFSLGPIALSYRYTMLWKPSAKITPRLVLVGFSQIVHSKKGQLSWEMVARLMKDKMARDIGAEEEKVKTQALVGDLRIPVYDTGVLWIRKTERTQRLISRWVAALKRGEDEAHAFLRALYAEGVLLCTLPAA